MKVDLNCPVECVDCRVKTSPSTQDTYVMFTLGNLSDQTVQTVEMDVICYDPYGAELARVPARLRDANAAPHTTFGANKAVSVKEYPETKRAALSFRRIAFEDGSEYLPTEGVSVRRDDLQGDALTRLRLIAGDDAVCYESENGDHWVCVCGRPNLPEADACARCGRSLEDMRKHMANAEQVKWGVERQRDEEREEARRQEQEAEARRAERKAKRIAWAKRAAVLLCAAVVALAALAAAGRGVVSLVAGRKASGGDYRGAYVLYEKIGSKKAAPLQSYAVGNDMGNIQMFGLAAEDGEAVYRLDNELYIMRLGKDGNEQKLDKQGQSLNVVGDELYFINIDVVDTAQTDKIYKMKTDGTGLVKVTDDRALTMIVVGDHIYYQKEEEDGSSSYLYRVSLDGKRKKRITKEVPLLYNVCGDRVYYMDETQSLHSVSLSGKGDRAILSCPIATFAIRDGYLYYTDATSLMSGASTASEPALPMMRSNLDGSEPETVNEGVKIYSYLYAAEDGFYFENFDRQLVKTDGTFQEQTVLSENPINLFNLTSEHLYLYNGRTFFELDR